jgi:hypothetical protein
MSMAPVSVANRLAAKAEISVQFSNGAKFVLCS